MEALRLFRSLNRDQRNTFIACFLGWTLDALDFFLLTFVLSPVAHDFQRTIPEVAFAITLTLMMRPLGGFIFGLLGDKFGRRIPLMADIIFYSLMELLTAFAPNFTIFLLLRALYGIGMGGEWGLGASLAMESLPTEARGLFSGILQQGYAFGYLLAAVVYWIVFPFFGWRGLFVAGALPALLVIYIRARVPESPVWQRHREQKERASLDILGLVRRHGLLFMYAVLLMTAFNYMSHGTQDLYPTFLEKQRGFDVSQKSMITIVYALGAICGGTIVGFLSQRWGRRRSIILCCAGRHVAYSSLDFCADNCASGYRWVPHAIHGARRVGCCPGAFERTFAAARSRNVSRPRLSIGKLRRCLRSATTSLAGRTFPRREWQRELRAHHGLRRARRFYCDHYPRSDRTRSARDRVLAIGEPSGGAGGGGGLACGAAVAPCSTTLCGASLINANTVPLLNNCFGDFIRKLIAMIGTARGSSLRAIAEKTALHEYGWIHSFSQHAKICRMHAPIHRARQREQFILNPSREIVRHRRMVIRLEAMNRAAT